MLCFETRNYLAFEIGFLWGGGIYNLKCHCSLQFPFFYADFDYSFQYLQRSEFRNLKAIQIDTRRFEAVSFLFLCNRAFSLFKAKILQVAEYCPNLEHFSTNLLYEARWDIHMQNYVVDIPNSMVLHQFQRLSSLEIYLEFKNFNDFHKVNNCIWTILNNSILCLSPIRCTALMVNERTLLFWKF
jgi:hypothetical protein